MVVNARHVKNVPGRKTDIADAQWLATLARAGLLRGSFIPPATLRELPWWHASGKKLMGMGSEKNRLHKVLIDAGIRISVVVSDIHGQSARAMVKALIGGSRPTRCCATQVGVSRPVETRCSRPSTSSSATAIASWPMKSCSTSRI